ncbi:MAG: hypothetical protein WB558_07960 [Terriglobales bacterium]
MPAEAVKEPIPVEPAEAAEGERGRSTISFPYNDLDDVVKVAKAVQSVGGTSCHLDELAAKLGAASSNSGTFRLRLLAAKTFTVLNYDKGVVTLTSLGSRICDPQQERAARVEAFLAVPLYAKVYEEFKSGSLPPVSGLENFMVKAGVAEKQKDKARQVFQRSAKQAGFSEYGDRLVRPSIKASDATPAITPTETPEPEKKKGKDADDEKELPYFIKGLLEKLPPPDTEWPNDKRAKWLEAMVKIFDLMYTDSEDDSRRSITIGFQKNSAN